MAGRTPESQSRSRRKTEASPHDPITKSTHLPSPPSSRRWQSTTSHHAPGFWNLLKANNISLSLNKRTLQELDRRNSFEIQRRNLLEERPSEGLRAQIASAELKRFARLGGPDLSNIKGYPKPESVEMTSGRAQTPCDQRRTWQSVVHGSNRITKSTSKTSISGRSSAYKSDFMRLLITDRVDRARRTKKPANYDHLRSRLEKPRGSLSLTQFSEAHYENFLDAIDNAFDEVQVMIDVFSVLKGNKRLPSRTNHACKNWAPLISANLVIPQPDFFDGAEQSAADSELRQALDGVIVPSVSSNTPFLPNFFAEVNAPGASAEVARRQAVYDGAFGARAMHHLKAYGASETFDENAYTLSSTYTDFRLEIFAHFVTEPDGLGRPPHYHTVSLDRWMLDKDVEAFRTGVTAFRNARDLAQEYRDTFIADANQRMQPFSQESRGEYMEEAFQRIREIAERNGSFGSSVSTSRSDPPNEKGHGSESDAMMPLFHRQAEPKKWLRRSKNVRTSRAEKDWDYASRQVGAELAPNSSAEKTEQG